MITYTHNIIIKDSELLAIPYSEHTQDINYDKNCIVSVNMNNIPKLDYRFISDNGLERSGQAKSTFISLWG